MWIRSPCPVPDGKTARETVAEFPAHSMIRHAVPRINEFVMKKEAMWGLPVSPSCGTDKIAGRKCCEERAAVRETYARQKELRPQSPMR
jgi:hypothetical protein